MTILIEGAWDKNCEVEVIMKYNLDLQFYKGIPLRLIERKSYKTQKAKRFTINSTNQNVWIPNKHLTKNGTIKEGENLDYIFKKAKRQLEIAGVNCCPFKTKKEY